MISVLYFIRKISAQYNIKTKNINNNGINIEEWIELSPDNLILAGWWSVFHQSTEYLIIGIFFILQSLNKNILYFKSPTDIKNNQNINFDKKIRVGGMVKKNSLIIKEEEIKFIITDFNNELNISFSGTVPNLFSEEKGVVAEGKLQDKTFFIADRILAKHDENYMPPELKDMMKKNAK